MIDEVRFNKSVSTLKKTLIIFIRGGGGGGVVVCIRLG